MKNIYLSVGGGISTEQYGFQRPMYKGADEIVDIIKIAIREIAGKPTASARTLESGVVEEYAVIEKSGDGKALIFRFWPVFYSHDRRVEYKIYDENPNIQELVRYYLGIFAQANAARLVVKT